MMRKIIKGLLIALAVLINISAFYVVAISKIGILDKAVVFAVVVMYDVAFVLRNEYQRFSEIADSVAKARLELIAADTEIRYKDMFSDPDSLIDLVHKHIKIAQEHLNDVR
jgi:hypothetical protein